MFSNSNGLGFTQLPYCIHHTSELISSKKSAVVEAAELRSAWTLRLRSGQAYEGARPHTNQRLVISHRHVYARVLRKLLCLVIARVHVANHAHAWIGRQHALD